MNSVLYASPPNGPAPGPVSLSDGASEPQVEQPEPLALTAPVPSVTARARSEQPLAGTVREPQSAAPGQSASRKAREPLAVSLVCETRTSPVTT